MYRVSDVLGYHPAPFLTRWQQKNGWKFCERVRVEATDVGTIVDEYVQDYINDNLDSEPTRTWKMSDEQRKNVENCTLAWLNFIDDHPEFLEKAVKHKANMQKELVLGDLRGHPDFIFPDELPDLKTSKQISMSNWMQVAQYAHMENDLRHASESPNVPTVNKISILRLDKYDEAGKYEYVTVGEPHITFWQKQFEARYKAMLDDIGHRQALGKGFYEYEDEYWRGAERKRLEQERLG